MPSPQQGTVLERPFAPRTTGRSGRSSRGAQVDIDAEDDDLLAAQLGSIKWTLDSRMDQDQVEAALANKDMAIELSSRPAAWC